MSLRTKVAMAIVTRAQEGHVSMSILGVYTHLDSVWRITSCIMGVLVFPSPYRRSMIYSIADGELDWLKKGQENREREYQTCNASP